MFSYGCKSVKDGLSLKKKENSQQFLIEKKQPLVMPPDFEKLPKPGSLKTSEVELTIEKSEDFDLETLIKNSKKDTKNNNNTDTLSLEIEKKINKELNKK